MQAQLNEDVRVKAESARTARVVNSAARPETDPTGCGLLADHYRRQAIWATLFTAVWFGLIAMTAVVLVVALGLLVWLLATLQSDTVGANAIKLIGTVGTAAGTIITGVAANKVKAASDAQNILTKEAAEAAATACKVPVGGLTVR